MRICQQQDSNLRINVNVYRKDVVKLCIIDNIIVILKEKKLKQSDLCDYIGINTSTLTTWKSRKTDPPARYIIRICEFLDVSPYLLLTGKEKNTIKNQLPKDEQEFFEIFNNLLDINKAKVIERAKTLAEIEIEEQEKKKTKFIEKHTNPGYIESYTLPASAGTGVDLDACEKIMLKVKDADLISGANFAVRISGDSMEPALHDGQYALVRTCPKVEQNDIGIFTVNSEGSIKKLGAGELISLNPKYKNIKLHEYDDIRCRGEVIGTLEPEDIISTEEY